MTSMFGRVAAHSNAGLRILVSAAAAAALAFAAAPAGAVILATGDNALTGTTSAAEPNLAGLIVEDELQSVSFAMGNGIYSADVQSRVVLSVDGTYDFYWAVRNTRYTGTDGDGLGNFRIGDFGIPIAGLNGNFRTDGLGDVGPDNAHVFSGSFDQFVNFEFDPLTAPDESFFMFLDTDAHHYAKTAFFDLANLPTTQISDSFATFGVSTVPEPASWALMITGFAAAGALLRRRRGAPAAA